MLSVIFVRSSGIAVVKLLVTAQIRFPVRVSGDIVNFTRVESEILVLLTSGPIME